MHDAPKSRRPAEKAGPPKNAQSPWVSLRSGTNHPFIFKRMIWTGDSLTWDRRTNRIEAPNARVTSSQ